MKILFTGASTGGHFFPIIAVSRALKKTAEEERIVSLDLYLADVAKFDEQILFEEGIKFIKIPAGKVRRYFSLLNLGDTFKTVAGILTATWRVYLLMPDVIFSKGGFSSFPTLFAARLFGIPTIIHESDVVPGVVNRWASGWARRIAISFPDTTKYLDQDQVELTGNPIRPQIVGGNLREAIEEFKLEDGVHTVLVMGGSQGAEKINDTILTALPELVKDFHVIHQAGPKLFKDVSGRSSVILERNNLKNRYHAFAFLDENNLRNASRAASIIIARGGSSLFEIAAWNLPAIIIPLPNSAQDHQRKNAYAYARAGACIVMEESNITPLLLVKEIKKILDNPETIKKMKQAAQTFSRLDAAEKIAQEILKLGVHEQ